MKTDNHRRVYRLWRLYSLPKIPTKPRRLMGELMDLNLTHKFDDQTGQVTVTFNFLINSHFSMSDDELREKEENDRRLSWDGNYDDVSVTQKEIEEAREPLDLEIAVDHLGQATCFDEPNNEVVDEFLDYIEDKINLPKLQEIEV